MTTEENTTPDEVISDAKRFADILTAIREGADVNNDDAVFLVQLVGSLDNNLTLANDIVESLGRSITDMARSLAFSVLARAGRSDQKIKKSVLKIVDEHVETLWTMARIQAIQTAQALTGDLPNEEETEVPS